MENKNNIKLIFYTGRDPLARTINKITRGEISHCGFLLNDFIVADTDLLRNFSLRFLPWKKEDFILLDINLNERQKADLIDWVYRHIGTKYDFWENIKYLFNQLIHKNDDTMMNCAESVIVGLCEIGYLHPAFEAETLSPQEVYDIVKNRN